MVTHLAFRNFRDGADLPGMLRVLEASLQYDRIEEVPTLELLRHDITARRNMDPIRDVRLAEVEGRTVAYNVAFWLRENDGVWTYRHYGLVDPIWRKRGLGRAMLRHAEGRLREIAAAHARDEAASRVFQSAAWDSQPDRISLLVEEGYSPARSFSHMVRPDLEDIPDLSLPEGIVARSAGPDELRRVWETDQEAFHDHWGESTGTEADYQRWLVHPTFHDRSLWQLAWDGDRVVGMVLPYIDAGENEAFHRRRGYPENICVLPAYRHRGIARALIARSLRELKARGMTEAALGVDRENADGALNLYTDMGFRMQKLLTFYRKPLEMA